MNGRRKPKCDVCAVDQDGRRPPAAQMLGSRGVSDINLRDLRRVLERANGLLQQPTSAIDVRTSREE
jgi:hypothetical protein